MVSLNKTDYRYGGKICMSTQFNTTYFSITVQSSNDYSYEENNSNQAYNSCCASSIFVISFVSFDFVDVLTYPFSLFRNISIYHYSDMRFFPKVSAIIIICFKISIFSDKVKVISAKTEGKLKNLFKKFHLFERFP